MRCGKEREEITTFGVLETEVLEVDRRRPRAAKARECDAVLALWKSGTLYLIFGFMMIV